MTYTDEGTKLSSDYDWMPLAWANGIEWAYRRRGQSDRWNNLYRRRWGVCGLLWYGGALMSTLGYRPAWIAPNQRVRAE